MGGGASSLHRVRQIIVMRAFNICEKNSTVAQLFYEHVHFDDNGDACLSIDSIKQVLQVETTSSLLDPLLRCNFNSNDILFDDFVSFLETGMLPCLRGNGGRQVKHLSAARIKQPTNSNKNDQRAVYNTVFQSLGFRVSSKSKTVIPYQQDNLKMDPTTKNPKNGNHLWKKHETLIHERIVKYVTLNADGSLEELVEREKKQDEVVHMECKDTGIFAHHEHSQFEKTEAFNGELVAGQRGTEEYCHLKSLDDEYEYFDGPGPTAEETRANGDDFSDG